MGGKMAEFFQNNPASMLISPNYLEKQMFGSLPFSTNAMLDKASGKSDSIMGSMGGGGSKAPQMPLQTQHAPQQQQPMGAPASAEPNPLATLGEYHQFLSGMGQGA